MTFATPYKNDYYRRRKKLIAAAKVLTGCVDCGIWGPDTILSFDHVRGEKEFAIGSKWDVGLARLEEEIAKCEVVCHNCHALRTVRRNREEEGPVFIPFPKIPRLNRDVVISEKIDGTNGTIWIDGDGEVWAGSKNRWLTLEQDNFGFAAWANEHAEALFDLLGEGVHRGEWWGQGVGRCYDMDHKVFSLFNTNRWGDLDHEIGIRSVPVLYEGPFSESAIGEALHDLEVFGSIAAPGFLDPEGVVVFHSAANLCFKITIKDDAKPKGSNE